MNVQILKKEFDKVIHYMNYIYSNQKYIMISLNS